MNREHTRYFSKINERRHALLTIQFSGGKRTDAQEAELASILAQMDVLEAAEAMVRGQFDWQHEQIKGMADVAGKMYEALRAHEKATTGNVFDELEVRNQRDRALALLREWALSDEENRWDVTVRTRALLAEVAGPDR